MLKEIMEQPVSTANCLRGRLLVDTGRVRLGGIQATIWKDKPIVEWFLEAPRIVVVACGTSFNAGMVGKCLIEELCHIPVEVEYASEFRYRKCVLEPGCIVIAVSQSGETADTLSAVKLAREKGNMCIGIVNAVGSSIARETDGGVYLHAGPEVGVASTKAFTAQICAFSMLALAIMQADPNVDLEALAHHVRALAKIPEQMGHMLTGLHEQVQKMVVPFCYVENFLYLGRGAGHAVAIEGSLKLKEISYIHAEGFNTAEMRHSLIALVDNRLPAFFICGKDDYSYIETVNAIKEYVARGGVALAVTDSENPELDEICDKVIIVPHAEAPLLQSLLDVIPLQMFAYYLAVARGCNVDKPRNLAKSVTVE